MAVKVLMLVFWVVMPCRIVGSYTEDGGCMFFRNIRMYLQVHMVLRSKRPTSVINNLLHSPSFVNMEDFM
jgi:hypothetical protein